MVKNLKKYAFLGFFLLHGLLLFSIKFTAWPEMLAYPYLLSHGFHFYSDIIQPYVPLLPFILFGLGKVFGLSVLLLRTITFVIILITDLLLWWWLHKLFKKKIALITFFLYVLLQVSFDGNGLWFDLVIAPWALGAYYFLSTFVEKRQNKLLFLAGLLLGVAMIIKQTAVWCLLVSLLYLVWQKQFKSLAIIIVASLLPIFLLLFFFPPHQLFYWTLVYPFTIAPTMSGYVQYPSIKQLAQMLALFLPLVWLFKIKSQQSLLLLGWFLASLGFLFPRFDYFHLQPALPFLMIGLAWVATSLKKKQAIQISLVYFLGIGLLFCKFITHNFLQPVRFFDKQLYDTAQQLNQKLPKNQPIFFYNTPAQYFIAAQLLPTKPWADTFPWYLEIPGLQTQIIKNLDQVNFVILAPIQNGGAYDLGSYRPVKIDTYISSHFTLTDTVGELKILQRKN